MLKIRIELDSNAEEEVIIRCKELSSDIIELQQILTEATNKSKQIILYKDDTEYYLEIDRILFFETENSQVLAHTDKEVFETRMKLYELESILGGAFLRISKSAIVNTNKIYAISRNITASSAIEFQGTHKQIYVSRAYYKALKMRLEEKRYEG